MGEILRVRGGRPLEGTVRLPSAKNSVLPILAAAVLADGPVVLRDVPDLADVHASVAILRALGLTVRRRGGDLHLLPAPVPGWQLPEAPARAMRSSVFYLAPVLHRAGCVRMPMPGGCRLGPRPIDIHLDGLSRMGAQTLWEDGWLELRTSARLQGIDYTLRLPSVGATETLIMAAALAKGDTVLRNVAREPEIRDLADFLNACGARIEGAGQPVIRVQGKTSLHGARHRPIPDRIVAATVAAAVAGCGGCVTMLGTGEDPLGPVADVLERAGCHTDHPAPESWRVQRQDRLQGVGLVRTGVWPGFSTDAAPVVAGGLLAARGDTVVEDTVFEDRFACAEGFAQLGGQVCRRGRALAMHGPVQLSGARVRAADLRGGAGLAVAALAAAGESVVEGAEYVRRGYADLAGMFRALGADVCAGRENRA